ncbi:MAG: MBL fold metallo-hydrolase [Gammaproteobacteria bacterium]|jgi:glyoxylase-like metal-dependent hydrolase (beta-lactamase superfamily II)|nr:MBL fold metallo-hydrolase [Gammaproteobacteria bacterium]MBT4605953.1 MBL fold metallo-hydrolase [Thiotrichales bacterium]
MSELKFQEVGFGITLIEGWYEREGMACSYLIESNGAVALVDTGTARVSLHILELLEQRGIAREQVKYIIPTHVHLDHAGGAGQLMQALPEAQLIIHPYGTRHMVDPSKLQAGATAVYGKEKFKKAFDQLLPIPVERVTEMEEGMELDLNGRPLRMVDTPGHAKHHLCVWDEQSKGLFTGDVYGNSYPELTTVKGRYLTPVTSPVQLDPPAWHASIDKILAMNPERLFLTHYGILEQPAARAEQLHKDLDAYLEMATALPPEGRYEKLFAQINEYHQQQVKVHGCELSNEELDRLIGSDNELCAQGLEVWMQRQERA